MPRDLNAERAALLASVAAARNDVATPRWAAALIDLLIAIMSGDLK